MDVVKQLAADRPKMDSLGPVQSGTRFQINDFIHCIPSISHVYLLNTPEGDIQINAGMGFEAPVIASELAPVRSGPLPWMILTQGHVDHVGGVSQLRQPETKLIAQRNNPACQEDDRRIEGIRGIQSSIWFPRENLKLKETKQPAAPVAVAQDRPVPDIMFDDRHDLELGGLKLELLSISGGETLDSLAVHLPQHRIVFTGNQFGPLFPHFPNLYTIRGDKYRYPELYLASLNRIRDLDAEILITGHFQPIVGRDLVRACLDRLHDAVTHVIQTTLDGMNAGTDIFALMRDVTLPEHLYVGQGYGKVSYCVRTVWEQYMGWFRADVTSDLYPTRAREIYGDLVDMAGIEVVVAKGRERLEAGDIEKAVLFAETALVRDAGHKGALGLSLDAHRALVARSTEENFWEMGWLRTQVARLEAACT